MHGLFEWVDVSVPDAGAAVSFYERLFGWTTEEQDGYFRCLSDGRLAAGIVGSDSTVGWNSYVTVDSADSMADRVTELGGTVLTGPTDIGSAGRLVWLEDPLGGRLGLWQAAEHRGAEAYNEPGFLTWNEVRTDDPDAARSFYGALFPEWSFQDLEVEGGFYTMVKVGERDNAAIAPLGEHFGDLGSHWAVWFTVDDAVGDVARIESLGGSALGPVIETSYGPAARVADPFGSPFLIIGPMAAPD